MLNNSNKELWKGDELAVLGFSMLSLEVDLCERPVIKV